MSYYPTRLDNEIFNFGAEMQVDDRTRGHNYPMHWHEFYEIDIIYDGECEFVVNGMKYVQKSGMISFLSPIDFHSLSPKGQVKHFNIMFYSEFISDTVMMLLNKAKTPVMTEPDKETFGKITDYCKIMMKEQRSEGRMSRYYLKNLLECVILDILKCTKQVDGMVIENASVVRKALGYIQEHFTEDIVIEDIAKICFLSESYIAKLFKKYTGMTFHDYIAELRCRYARNLICSTDIRLQDICFESGFNSISQFSRTFKEMYSMTPGAYRKKYMAVSGIL